MAFSERIKPVTQFIMHLEFKLNACYRFRLHLSDVFVEYKKACVPPACADHNSFDSCHQMLALVKGDPKVNKFEPVSSDGHQMSLAGEEGPCTVKSHVWVRHDWKHYLPSISLAGGKKQHHWTSHNITFDVQGINKWNPLHSLLIFRQHQTLTLGDLNWLIF